MTHQAFDLGGVLAERARLGERFREFLRVPALSAGVYMLPVGGNDPQTPHAEDEVVAHRFHTITEELSVLVFFAPAEASGGGRC